MHDKLSFNLWLLRISFHPPKQSNITFYHILANRFFSPKYRDIPKERGIRKSIIKSLSKIL